MKEIRILEGEYKVDPYKKTKVTSMGNVTELLTLQKDVGGGPCRKIDKDHYLDIRTGEVLEYKHIENRAQELESIRHTICKIRELINTNVTDPENVRWVTLTYGENMTDPKRLYEDFRRFWMRFKYWCEQAGYEKPEYITVQEPQGRGAWHVHAFFIWDVPAPFIPNNAVLERLWGHGWTKIKALKNIDNPGAYFSAYLGDLPVDEYGAMMEYLDDPANPPKWTVEEKELVADDGTKKKKKFIKGARLFMYPPGMNIIRTTKGIKRPLVEYMARSEAEKKVSAGTETFSRTYEVLGADGEVVNTISKAYYNSRKK